jgi:hypothetical protein
LQQIAPGTSRTALSDIEDQVGKSAKALFGAADVSEIAD